MDVAVPTETERKLGRPVKPRAEAQVAPWRRGLLMDEQQDE